MISFICEANKKGDKGDDGATQSWLSSKIESKKKTGTGREVREEASQRFWEAHPASIEFGSNFEYKVHDSFSHLALTV